MKRLITVAMALALVVCMPLSAYADVGVWGGGGFSNTIPAYTMESDYALASYNGMAEEDPDWGDIYPGSAIYLPLSASTLNDEGVETWAAATDKQVKADAVKATYKATKGSQYIDGVTIVDIKKEKLKNLPAAATGMYVKVQVSERYSSTRATNVMLRIVLNVNRVSYQETEVELGFDLVNRTVYIDRDSVYGAQVPTMFEADYYSGEATFDLGDGVTYTGHVKSGGKYVINYTTEEVADIADMNTNAYMEFHRFLGGQTSFAGIGDLEIPIDTSDFQGEDGKAKVYAYEIEGDQLKALGSDVATYKSGVLTIRARTLGEYVLSSASLLRDVTSADTGDVLQSGYASQQAASSTAPPPSSTAPPTTPAPTPTGTGGNNINASNVSGGNPVTGTSNHLPAMALTAALAGGVALVTWKKKPFSK